MNLDKRKHLINRKLLLADIELILAARPYDSSR